MAESFIATFEKNSKEEVRFSVDEFHGKKLINIRVYFRDNDGQYKPGKQGLAVSVDLYRHLAGAIVQVGEHLQEVGLLTD
jgi:hypothetical protein